MKSLQWGPDILQRLAFTADILTKLEYGSAWGEKLQQVEDMPRSKARVTSLLRACLASCRLCTGSSHHGITHLCMGVSAGQHQRCNVYAFCGWADVAC